MSKIRVLRGGSFNYREFVCSASRSRDFPLNRFVYVGFRVVVMGGEKRFRVLRGGSFSDFHRSIHCACCNRFEPGDLFRNRGLRVVVNRVRVKK